MRYLSSISLALIMLMALACTATAATPAPTPTPTGPMYSEEEAIAVLKEHLQTKSIQGERYPCLMVIENTWGAHRWVATYDNEANRWDIKLLLSGYFVDFTWSVYERTKSIVATGDDPLNQLC